MYEIYSKSSRDGKIFDSASTSIGVIRIVKRDNGYRLRRSYNRESTFEWDLSREVFTTLEEAESAMLSGKCTFKFR